MCTRGSAGPCESVRVGVRSHERISGINPLATIGDVGHAALYVPASRSSWDRPPSPLMPALSSPRSVRPQHENYSRPRESPTDRGREATHRATRRRTKRRNLGFAAAEGIRRSGRRVWTRPSCTAVRPRSIRMVFTRQHHCRRAFYRCVRGCRAFAAGRCRPPPPSIMSCARPHSLGMHSAAACLASRCDCPGARPRRQRRVSEPRRWQRARHSGDLCGSCPSEQRPARPEGQSTRGQWKKESSRTAEIRHGAWLRRPDGGRRSRAMKGEKVRVSAIATLREQLRSARAPEPEEVSKHQAVRMLLEDIHVARANGCSMKDIAAMLHAAHVDISEELAEELRWPREPERDGRGAEAAARSGCSRRRARRRQSRCLVGGRQAARRPGKRDGSASTPRPDALRTASPPHRRPCRRPYPPATASLLLERHSMVPSRAGELATAVTARSGEQPRHRPAGNRDGVGRVPDGSAAAATETSRGRASSWWEDQTARSSEAGSSRLRGGAVSDARGAERTRRCRRHRSRGGSECTDGSTT